MARTVWFLRALKFAAAVGAFALLPVAPAQAGFCAQGSTCDFELTNTNKTGVDVDIRVTVDNTGATSLLTVQFISSNLTNTALGIDQFGFNSTAGTTNLPAGFSAAANCPCQLDGFGSFLSEIDNPGGTDLSFSFGLTSLVTTFTDNANGGEFAAHIRFSGGCSAFVSDGTASSPTADTACIVGPPPLLPEPGSLSLFGLALIALVGLTRIRSRA